MTDANDQKPPADAGRLDLRVVPHEPRTNEALGKTIHACGYLSAEVHGALTDCCRELEREIERLVADRRVLQAIGKHAAPCARFCEAQAFTIELRRALSDAELLAWMLNHPETCAEVLEDAARDGGDPRVLVEERRAALRHTWEVSRRAAVGSNDGLGPL